ncbi:MAG: metal ABC transporter solute-binding protein, Zn/Mn family [Acidimicrobiales bacterium]
MRYSFRALLALVTGLGVMVTACGDDEGASADVAADDDRPSVVVTTSILGDVVRNLVGDQIEVVTIMPVGADPHDFQASAQQVAQIGEAEVLIVNGAGFEEGLLDVIESAEADGVPTFEAVSAIETVDFDEDDADHADEDGGARADEDDADHADEDDADHADEDDADHADEDGHGNDHEGVDPHFFTDPARMATAADAIVDFLVANVVGVDASALEATAADYIDELEALDGEVTDVLAAVPAERRVLVTNHEVFGYFADRYDFEVVGTVVPSGTTADGASAQALAELAELIESEGVPAIFADTSSSDDLANTLAAELGDVAVVELFSESLGSDDSGGGTYLDMVRTNAQRIAEALAG